MNQLRLWDARPAALPRSFWQRRFYDFNVWTNKKRIEKLNYMHMNPVKRGLVGGREDVGVEQLPLLSVCRKEFVHAGCGTEVNVRGGEFNRERQNPHPFANPAKSAAPAKDKRSPG